MLDTHSSLLITLAGIAFFMFGMTLASENLQKLAANRTRDLIAKLSQRPFLGVILGISLTLMIQSSGAVTSMLVGLGSAGVITLQQVMSVILGAAVGTTFTVQLLSLNIAQYGLPIFTISFIIFFLSKNRTLKNIVSVAMGFGLIFWGLEMIGEGTSELRHVEMFTGMLESLSANPFLTIVVTAIFTAVVHSSAVTIGFAMTLASSGILSLHEAFFWVFGANIGTTGTALLASTGGNYVGRQVAWAHAFYKIVGVLLFVPLAGPIAAWLSEGAVERSVANFHTLFNVLAALIFFPGVKWGARLVEKLFPPSSSEQEFSVKYLQRSDWQSTSVAMAHAEREVMRMGDIVLTMVKDSLDLFRNEDVDLEESIRERDDRVDLLTREINLYLATQLETASGRSHEQIMQTISFASDLESAADVIDNVILELARKKHSLKLEFSDEGWKDLEKLNDAVIQVCTLSLSAFQTQDRDLAAKVIFHKREIRKMEREMRESHIERLVQRRRESINTSSIHIDTLGEYRRIVGLLSNHVYSLMKDSDEYNILPRRDS